MIPKLNKRSDEISNQEFWLGELGEWSSDEVGERFGNLN